MPVPIEAKGGNCACNRDLADQDLPSPDISYGIEKIKTQSIVRCWGPLTTF